MDSVLIPVVIVALVVATGVLAVVNRRETSAVSGQLRRLRGGRVTVHVRRLIHRSVVQEHVVAGTVSTVTGGATPRLVLDDVEHLNGPTTADRYVAGLRSEGIPLADITAVHPDGEPPIDLKASPSTG